MHPAPLLLALLIWAARAGALHDDSTPNAQAALRTLLNAQRQWIGLRDDDCDAVYLAHHGAALRERHRLRCKIRHAEMRARQLDAYDSD